MGMINKIGSSIFAIKDLLVSNENLRKLLYYETPDALLRATPSIEEVEDRIKIVPRIVSEEGIAESFEKTFIVIYHSDSSPIDQQHEQFFVVFNVGVYTNSDTYLLDNRKTRVTAIQSEVAKTLARKKLSHSGTLVPGRLISEVMVKEDYIGLLASWSVVDRYDY